MDTDFNFVAQKRFISDFNEITKIIVCKCVYVCVRSLY